MMTDSIADLLTRIRNAHHAEKIALTLPGSKIKSAIAKVLQDEGYIEDFDASVVEGKPSLTIKLKYYEGSPVIISFKELADLACAYIKVLKSFQK